MEENTTNQVRKTPNPSGKGGFGDNPQNRSDGRWSKENSFSYWMNYFKSLPVSEFLDWLKGNPEKTRSMASDLAYTRVLEARKELKEFEVVANRTEGMPRQSVGLELDNDITEIEIKIKNETITGTGQEHDKSIPEEPESVSEQDA
jgi:hypothetical protein